MPSGIQRSCMHGLWSDLPRYAAMMRDFLACFHPEAARLLVLATRVKLYRIWGG
jgi:hypothetical protein